jgi:hypothetical protein
MTNDNEVMQGLLDRVATGQIISGPTMAAAVMIGGRAAELIKASL